MKDTILDAHIIAARPEGAKSTDATFTDRVMAEIVTNEVASRTLRKTGAKKSNTFFMRLRYLPKIAIVAIAVGVLLFLAGTTYAVVQTVSHFSKVTVNEAGVNEFGRQQLSVEFDSCDAQKKEGMTYELKKGSNLTAEDGLKALQAQCDLDMIQAWIQSDPRLKQATGAGSMGPILPNRAATVKETKDNKLTLAYSNDKATLLIEKDISADVRVVEGDTVTSLDTIKPGDTVIYFSSAMNDRFMDRSDTEARGNAENIIFKLSLEARYYSIETQSYVHARSTCDGNPERTCLKSNNINQVTLTVATGGQLPSMADTGVPRSIQGRVVSYDVGSIKLDAGKGATYTIHTPYSVIDHYNRSGVYGLSSFDSVYARTDPEDLKIKPGDSLSVYYREPADEFSKSISWDQIGTIELMVERSITDLNVLRKY